MNGGWGGRPPQADPGDEQGAVALLDPPEVVELDDATAWRYEQLIVAGFSHEQAMFMADGRNNIDWHHAVALVEKGCTPDLCFAIIT